MRSRRDLLGLFAASAAAGVLPRPSRAQAKSDLYDIGRTGNVRLLHMTDTHGQLLPLHFREPSVNIGMGESAGRRIWSATRSSRISAWRPARRRPTR